MVVASTPPPNLTVPCRHCIAMDAMTVPIALWLSLHSRRAAGASWKLGRVAARSDICRIVAVICMLYGSLDSPIFRLRFA